jgi:hypothetical protein
MIGSIKFSTLQTALRRPKYSLVLTQMLVIAYSIAELPAFSYPKWGYINKNGTFVIEPTLKRASPFDGGYARVNKYRQGDEFGGDGRDVFIDKSGRTLPIEASCNELALSDGLVRFHSAGKVGYKKPDGTIHIEPNFADGSDFVDGLAIVRPEGTERFQIIDHQGKAVRQLPEDWQFIGIGYIGGCGYWFRSADHTLHEFASSWEISQVLTNDLPGFREKFEPDRDQRFDFYDFFSEGLALAEKKGGGWSYVDKAGNIVIDLPGDCVKAGEFHEGLAAVILRNESEVKGNVEGHFGFIDKTGKFVIAPKFPQPKNNGQITEWTSRFCEGLAPATSLDGQELVYGYVDRKGKFVIHPRFREATEFSGGLAAVNCSSVHFNPAEWKFQRDRDSKFYGVDDFKKFTREYKVIGMSREQLIRLLGEPDNIQKYGPGKHETYQLTKGYFCGNASLVGDIRYKNGIVTGYRVGGDWQTQNVAL